MNRFLMTHGTGVYVGSFDPITNGHCDIIQRASSLFQRLVVGIGHNTQKTPFFDIKERCELISLVCKELGDNIEVQPFTGLAVKFARSVGANVLVRGLRTESDYVLEMQMAMMNMTLSSEIETIFIPTRQDLSHISSSLVKEVALLGGNVSKLVPGIVYQKLRQKSDKEGASKPAARK